MSETQDISVTVSVDGIELDDQQSLVIDTYADNIETFLRKDENYGGSFENSAKLDSILRYGEVREDELFDTISEQILVRGFYDKLSRFHQLQIQDGSDRVGEDVEDTLLDMGNYAVMLAAMRRKYESESNTVTVSFDKTGDLWSKEDIESFMDEHVSDTDRTSTIAE